MTTATGVKAGHVVRVGNEFHKVLEAVVHSGGGRAGMMIHMKLRNVATGHVAERRFAPDDKLDDVPLTRTRMQFLYSEGDAFHFMNPTTYDQIPIPRAAIGPAAGFLKENDEIEVEFFEEKPLSILFAETVDLGVKTTGAGLRGQTDTTLKEAVLENGMQVLVPQFIKEGDRIRVDVQTGKYLERVLDREEKGAKFTVGSAGSKPSRDKAAGAEPRKDGGK